MHRVVYYNGDICNEDEVTISPFSRGLHYGDGVFETLRAYHGRFFRFEEHISRLQQGLNLLRINSDLNRFEICSAAEDVLRANKLSDACVKVVAFREGPEGPSPAPGLNASILITAGPFDHEKKTRYENGISGFVVSIRRNNYSPVPFVKSLNYLDNIVGRFEAREHNADEALFLNISGMVAEGATSNIFTVSQAAVYTPPIRAGILNGITREAVLRIASKSGIKCLENDFPVEQLFRADEVFLTNSLMEIMPLVSLNDKPIGIGIPGKITKDLMNSYKRILKKELGVAG